MSGAITERGAVLVAKRPIGFGSGEPERFLVVQATELNDVLGSTVVVPLDAQHPRYNDDAFAIRLAARETGARASVALVDLLQAIPRDRFQPLATSMAADATMARVDAALRLVLALA